MSYTLDKDGIYRPETPVAHRNEEYQESGFTTLLNMQSKHFWYVGRHKFLLGSLKKHLKESHKTAIDLGGGVGGWVKYLSEKFPHNFEEIALGDSSEVALIGARKILPKEASLYQVDLMATNWKEKWDVIFLLDVIEHCPDDISILKQAYESLKPGGLLIVTTPALMYFWSYNDDYSNHLRRYNISDYGRLAKLTGFNLIDARYFMFFLSPLYWLSRKTKPKNLSKEEVENAVQKEHAAPSRWVNFLLSKIFSAESPMGQYFKFPWGTSVLGVFEKP
ncbi:class I SAM-dependent methyltransferase [Noviherbaspirillum pedocola]|uniref:Class I SAM-dependent methyltransferase n=1 Tax=Noviherbaspirillum pedocola TaxID=2801341 RepID=A0A934SPA6_9BURK|nr:class I SAM-dependent methyltransferase [Noviherbaspirillum pedocola]MBK4734221.1 class I SAM-dependent methyltransferase [Noviherbaspirillum pedocola]